MNRVVASHCLRCGVAPTTFNEVSCIPVVLSANNTILAVLLEYWGRGDKVYAYMCGRDESAKVVGGGCLCVVRSLDNLQVSGSIDGISKLPKLTKLYPRCVARACLLRCRANRMDSDEHKQ